MQPQAMAKGHLARKKHTNSKRAFNLPVVDLSRTQDVSNITGNESQHIVNASSTSPLSSRYPRHSYGYHPSGGPPIYEEGHVQVVGRRQDGSYIYESHSPITARQSHSNSRRSLQSRKNSGVSQKSRAAAAVAALHYGRPTPPGHRPNQYSQRNISAFEENMQRVRESVYNRKKGLYSEVPISHGGRHTPTMPHPPPSKPGASREVSPVPGGYPQQTTFANFSKNASAIQKSHPLRSSEEISRSQSKRQARLKRGLSSGLEQRDIRSKTYVHTSTLHTPGGQLAQTQTIGAPGGRNHLISSTQLMESAGGSGMLIQAQGDSHERTKSYDRTLSPAIIKGGDTLKLSHKSFTGSSQVNEHTISVYDNKSRTVKSKSQQNSTNAATIAKLRNKLSKDRQTIPLDPINFTALQQSEYKIKEARNPPANNEGMAVFSNRGLTLVGKGKDQPSDFISSQNFIIQETGRHLYGRIPFFRHFRSLKAIRMWRAEAARARYERKRERLAKNFIFSKGLFSEHYPAFAKSLHQLETLNCFDITVKTIYGKKQQSMLDQKSNKTLDKATKDVTALLQRLRGIVDELKSTIGQMDTEFLAKAREEKIYKIVQKKKYDELIMFSQDRRAKLEQDDKERKLEHRRRTFDAFTELLLRIFSHKLVRVFFDNTQSFHNTLLDAQGPQFELSVLFSREGKISTDPTIDQHKEIFVNLFLRLDNLVFENKRIFQFVQCLNNTFFNGSKAPWHHKRIFAHVISCLTALPQYKQYKEVIFTKVEQDSALAAQEIQEYQHLEQIHDFMEAWKAANGGSLESSQGLTLEMGYYKETWARMDKYSSWIEKIPSYNTHINSIQIETANLKNTLSRLPKDIMKALRHNVTSTMEGETKALKSELVGKVMKTLERVPTDLNEFVKQIDMVKYVQLKQQDYEQRNNSIIKLYTLCKNDNIRVAPSLQLQIDEVQRLYEGLPKVLAQAKVHLIESKENIEVIMLNSTITLSKKIKSFEKKYVQNYLQMPDRLSNTTITLQQLIRRTQAIQEIRSKVLHYKEFLKLLREDTSLLSESVVEKVGDEPNLSFTQQSISAAGDDSVLNASHQTPMLEQSQVLETKGKDEKPLQCAMDFEFLNALHKTTSNLWKMLTYWQKRKEGFLANSLAKVDLKKIRHTIEKMVNFFEAKIDSEPFIRDKSRKLVNKVKLEIKEMAGILEFFRELKKDSLRVRHWVQILNYIKRPQLINVQFSINDLRKAQIQNYQTEIREVIKKADLEYKYELLLTAIKHEWKSLELSVVPYKLKQEAYIITQAEAVFSVIDQHMTTLESVENSMYAIHVRDEIRRWIVDLKIMEAMLERWMDTQRLWISLEPIFSSTKGLLSQVLLSVQERAQFEKINDKYMKVMWAAYRNPKATFTLLARNKISQFDDLLEYLRKIQQAVDAFIESRRLAFPRFFFLSDLQFLDFLSLVHQKKDFNEFIPILFPGASSVFLSRPLNSDTPAIPEMHHDPTAGPEMSIQASEEELAIQVSALNGNQEHLQQADRSRSGMRREGEFRSKTSERSVQEASGVWSHNESRQLKQIKRSTVREPSRHQHPEVLELDSSEILGSANSSIILQEYTSLQGRPDLDEHSLLNFPHQIMGFVSEHRQLFMFDRRVELTNERAEIWLQLVEASMKDSVGKMIHYAVSSFPKQSLDEWILDFPLQTILSTIHLILTHEINDLFQGMMRAIASGQNVNQLDDQDSYDSESSISQTPRTPDTRNILKSSHALSSKSSQTGTRQGRSAAALPVGDDSDEELMKEYKQKKQSKREEGSERGRRGSIMHSKKDDQSELEMADNRTNRSFDDQDEDELSEYEVNLEIERNRFASNMFGFDIDDSVIGPTKAQTIKALQEKSFKGLYMRLQFWITQIQKSLYQRAVSSEVKLPELQRHSMRTIITFLIYMRDVVNSLRKRGISSPDDNEWLKNVRLTCQQHEKLGCRVDCGNWSMQQANEYIGTSPRLLITPDTNRYFVHIASALREKSAVVARCVPAHDTASDVFKQFASLCTVPFQSFRASENTQMKLLMQYLNGAALASVWIFVEHMDRLKFEILQTFNKEVQMVQQQFIIAELSNNEQSLFNTGSLRMGGPPSQTASPQKDKVPIPSQMTEEEIKEGVKERIQQGMTNISMSMSLGGANQMSLIGKSKTCFGVFGSLSYGYEHRVTAGRTALTVTALSTMEKAKDLQYTLQSAYRVVQLIKPESENYLMFLLQSHGFKNPHEISRVYESFFYNMQNEYQKLRGSKPRILFLSREKERQSIKLEGVEEDPLEVFSVRASSTVRSSMRRQRIVRTAVEQHHDLITPNMRDMTVIIKLLSALFQYHQQLFLESRERRFKEKEPEMPVIEKKTKTKMMEKLNREKEEEIYRNERIQQIEVECLRKILQLYGQQRFFWMWKREADETVSMKDKSTRGFRKSTPFDVETPAPDKPLSGVVPQRKAPTLKRATTQVAPQVPSLQAALMKAHQLNRVRSNRTTESVKMTDAQIILKLSKSIARSLKLAFLSQDAKVSQAMEAMKQVEGSPSVAQIGASRDKQDEVHMADSKPRLPNIGSDVSLRSSAMIVTPALKFAPQVHPSDLDSIEALAAAPLAELQEEIEKATDPVMKKAISDCYDHFQLMRNNQQQSKAFMLYSSLRTYKLVAIVGPPCSGKSTLVQLLSGALKMGRNINLRKAHLVPSTLQQDQIFGVAKYGEVQEGAISLIMRKFQEKQHSDELPVNCLLLDGVIEPAWADSFMSFALKANKARMGLGYSITDNLGERHAFQDVTHVNLPNGVAIPFPSNAYIIFETLTLENATPSFVDTLCVISCDADNLLDWNGVLKKSLHCVYESESQFFSRQNNLDFGSLESTAESFLLPIINKAPLALKEWRFWNMKLIALSFAAVLRGTIRAFIRKHKELLSRDEPVDVGIAENSKLILESVILSSIIWSIGCMLPGTPTGENINSVGASKIMKSQSSLSGSSTNLKGLFDELIMDQLKKFKAKIPVREGETVFDYYFDTQRLQFMPFRYQELYNLKMYYDPSLNKMMLPTSAVTGALYLGDLVLKLQ